MSTNDFLTDRHKHVAVSLTWSMILSKCSDPILYIDTYLVLANVAASDVLFSCPLGLGGAVNGSYSEWQKIVAVSLTWSMILSKCSDPIINWHQNRGRLISEGVYPLVPQWFFLTMGPKWIYFMAIAGQAKFLEIKITVLSPMGSFNNHVSKERGRGSRYKGLTIYKMSTGVEEGIKIGKIWST